MPTPTKYTYSIATDTANGKVNSTTLSDEIAASSIIIALDHIDTGGDVLDIWFRDVLSAPDQTTLTSVVNAHTGNEATTTGDPVAVTPYKKSSYMAEGSTANANGKNMIGLFNPSGSGKVIRVWSIWFRCKSNTGNNVLAGYEIRRSSAQSGGTSVAKAKLDTADPISPMDVVDGSTAITVTDVELIQTWVIQTNTAQTPNSYEIAFGGELKSLILRPNEGIYIKMVTSNNTSAMNIGFAWTEET